MAARTAPRVAPLPAIAYEPVVRAALLEDLGLGGDLTSDATIAGDATVVASLVAREAGVLAGLDMARCAFRLLDGCLQFERTKHDGDRVEAAETFALVTGAARAVLGAERTALNLLAHLSGIASMTARYVAAVAGTACAISETRKTLPGLRALQKYAVRAGGGTNHRLRLDDAILIKDNHVALAGGIVPALRAARARAGHLVKVEIEVDTLAQLEEVLECGMADAVMLDNFTLDSVRAAVRRIAGALVVEVSGGVALDDVAAIARAGADVISVGALTHSARALDIGLDIVPV